MGILNPDTVDALNTLLEDVRASVEIEVALSNGATEFLEREALTAMGVEDTLIAFLLRDWLESLDLPVTRRINGIVLDALALPRYDERLLLLYQHQLASHDQAEQLLSENEFDPDGRAILRSIVDAHARYAIWLEQRAKDFAATRQLEFQRSGARIPAAEPNTAALDAGEDDPRPSASGEHSVPPATPVIAEPGLEDGAGEGDSPLPE